MTVILILCFFFKCYLAFFSSISQTLQQVNLCLGMTNYIQRHKQTQNVSCNHHRHRQLLEMPSTYNYLLFFSFLYSYSQGRQFKLTVSKRIRAPLGHFSFTKTRQLTCLTWAHQNIPCRSGRKGRLRFVQCSCQRGNSL